MRAPQWSRRFVCWLLFDHDEMPPDKEHAWRYCARCGATLANVFGQTAGGDDDPVA